MSSQPCALLWDYESFPQTYEFFRLVFFGLLFFSSNLLAFFGDSYLFLNLLFPFQLSFFEIVFSQSSICFQLCFVLRLNSVSGLIICMDTWFSLCWLRKNSSPEKQAQKNQKSNTSCHSRNIRCRKTKTVEVETHLIVRQRYEHQSSCSFLIPPCFLPLFSVLIFFTYVFINTNLLYKSIHSTFLFFFFFTLMHENCCYK